MKILVTGATGFVGKHLIEKLILHNYEIIVIVRKKSNVTELIHKNIEIIYTDENESYNFVKRNVDGIIHLATSYGYCSSVSEIFETNVVFPLTLLENCESNNVKFFINTDSFFSKAKGEYSHLSNYAKSKNFFVELMHQFSKNLTIVNFRLEHVYGENDSTSKFITHIIQRLANNESEVLLTSGLQKRDFIYIDDVTNAYLTVLERINELKGFSDIEVGTGESLSIRDAVNIIHRKVNSTSNLCFGALPTREGEFSESKANIEILKYLGWKAEYNFEMGISKILQQKK